MIKFIYYIIAVTVVYLLLTFLFYGQSALGNAINIAAVAVVLCCGLIVLADMVFGKES